MKFLLYFIVLFVGHQIYAETTKVQCVSFFEGIDKAPYNKEEMIKILNNDQSTRGYLRIMNADVVEVLDTGERARCLCYHYLVKYKSKDDGHVWIKQVNIRDGKVYVPPSKADNGSAGSTR